MGFDIIPRKGTNKKKDKNDYYYENNVEIFIG